MRGREDGHLATLIRSKSLVRIQPHATKRLYRIAAIAADCKSAPSGSVVRVHLQAQND